MIVIRNYSIDVCKTLIPNTRLLCINCTLDTNKNKAEEFAAIKSLADDGRYKDVWNMIIKTKNYSSGILICESPIDGAVCPFDESINVSLLRLDPPVLGEVWHPATLFFTNEVSVCSRCWRFRNGYNKSS